MSPFLSKKPVLRTQRWKRNGERLEHTPCLAGLGLVFRTKLTPNLNGGEVGCGTLGRTCLLPVGSIPTWVCYHGEGRHHSVYPRTAAGPIQCAAPVLGGWVRTCGFASRESYR